MEQFDRTLAMLQFSTQLWENYEANEYPLVIANEGPDVAKEKRDKYHAVWEKSHAEAVTLHEISTKARDEAQRLCQEAQLNLNTLEAILSHMPAPTKPNRNCWGLGEILGWVFGARSNATPTRYYE